MQVSSLGRQRLFIFQINRGALTYDGSITTAEKRKQDGQVTVGPGEGWQPSAGRGGREAKLISDFWCGQYLNLNQKMRFGLDSEEQKRSNS